MDVFFVITNAAQLASKPTLPIQHIYDDRKLRTACRQMMKDSFYFDLPVDKVKLIENYTHTHHRDLNLEIPVLDVLERVINLAIDQRIKKYLKTHNLPTSIAVGRAPAQLFAPAHPLAQEPDPENEA